MQVRKRGGQPGNTNALKTGVYSPRLVDRIYDLTEESTRAEILEAGALVLARVRAIEDAADRSYGKAKKAHEVRAILLTIRFLGQLVRITHNPAYLEKIRNRLLPPLPPPLPSRDRLVQLLNRPPNREQFPH